MSELTILHLSDLHFAPTVYDQTIVINALLSDLRSLRERRGISPNMIFFTGDLVLAGANSQIFLEAKQAFLDKVVAECGLTYNEFFIVPGNHDIDRETVRSVAYVENGLRETLTSTDETNRFIDRYLATQDANEPAFLRMSNYESFHQLIQNGASVSNNVLYKTYKATIAGRAVGIACFNTAWRATGEPKGVDQRRLILGERSIDRALDDLKDCEVRLAACHHPTSWLTEFDEASVVARLNSQFDILLWGHRHTANPYTVETPQSWCVISLCGCLYEARDYFNGYQIISWDPDSLKASFFIRAYWDGRREFDCATNIAPEGEFSIRLKAKPHNRAISHVEAFLRRARAHIRARANQHIKMLAGNAELRFDIAETFICPPIGQRPERAAKIGDKGDPKQDAFHQPEALLQSPESVVIFGAREVGKTSLAHYLAVRASEGHCDRPRIPCVLDFSHFRRGRSPLVRLIRQYFEELENGIEDDAKLQLDEIFSSGSVLVIFDNFDLDHRDRVKFFEKIKRENPGFRWICLADDTAIFASKISEYKVFDGCLIGYIYSLPRRSIRLLARRWSTFIDADGDETFETVMAHVNRANLPRTGYIISLLLWAISQKKDLERVNEAVLLENMVEYLLDKADFTGAQRKQFDYRSKELTLQKIADFIQSKGGYSEYNDVSKELIDYLDEVGLGQYVANDILEDFIRAGILGRQSNILYFKYRCFREYFTARRLLEDATAQSRLMKGWNYLEFAREIDLMSGLSRKNKHLVQALSKKLVSSRPDEIRNVDLSIFSNIEMAKEAVGLSQSKINQIKKRKLTAEQIDDLMDAAERKVRKSNGGVDRRERSRRDPTKGLIFILTLDLLGRVLKNSEFVGMKEKVKASEAFFSCWLQFLLFVFDSVERAIVEAQKESKNEFPLGPKELGYVEYFTRTVIPVWASGLISEEIGTSKIVNVLHELYKSSTTSLGEKILIIFCMLDIHSSDWMEYWRRFISDNRDNHYLMSLCLEKLWNYYLSTYIPSALMPKFEDLMGDIVVALGRPKTDKGQVIADMRRKSILRSDPAD